MALRSSGASKHGLTLLALLCSGVTLYANTPWLLWPESWKDLVSFKFLGTGASTHLLRA